MARIENWSIKETSNMFVAPEMRHKQLFGVIYDDEKGRFEDGDYIATSMLEELNLEEGWARTMNTTYTLGEPSQVYQEWLSSKDSRGVF